MLGNRVTVFLTDPKEEINGELRKQNSDGVYIYWGWGEKARAHFYPTHRIVEIEDLGYIHR
jgi:hypothetical protein